MKTKRTKKGFTLVELVIVIAVIAILAAILIPTFSGIINRAKVTKDTADTTTMNGILQTTFADKNVDVSKLDMGDILYALSSSDVAVKNLVPTAGGYHFAWDGSKNKILYLDSQYKIVAPENTEFKASDCWMISKSVSDVKNTAKAGFNVYLGADIKSAFTLDNLVSINTGDFTMSNITLKNATQEANIDLLGTFTKVTVNAPKAELTQVSGGITTLDIQAVKNGTFTVKSFVGNLTINQGNLEIAQSGAVTDLKVEPASNAQKIEIVNEGLISTVSKMPTEATKVEVTNTGKIAAVTAQGVEAIVEAGGDAVVTEITTVADLENFRDQVNAGRTYADETITLQEDLDLQGIAWTPISNYYRSSSDTSKFFQGIFDGNGKTISNLSNVGFNLASLKDKAGTNSSSISVNGKIYKEVTYGLFGSVNGATIKNLTLDNVNIDMGVNKDLQLVGDGVGAIVGFATGNFTMDNCHVTGTSSITGYDNVAGLVGVARDKHITITNCINSANVTAYRKVAGIVTTNITTISITDTAQTKEVVLNGNSNSGNITCKGVDADVVAAKVNYYAAAGVLYSSNEFTVPSTDKNTSTGVIKIGNKTLDATATVGGKTATNAVFGLNFLATFKAA